MEGTYGLPKHSNRVYNIKFEPEDPNLVYSSSWDRIVNLWDIRTEQTIGKICGVEIFGDSMDIYDN